MANKSWMLALVAVVALGLTGCASVEGKSSYPGSSSPDVSVLSPTIGVPKVLFFGLTCDKTFDKMTIVVENDRPASGVNITLTDGQSGSFQSVSAKNVGGFVYVAEIPGDVIRAALGEFGGVVILAHSLSAMTGYPGCEGIYFNYSLGNSLRMDSVEDLSPEHIERLRQQLEAETGEHPDNG